MHSGYITIVKVAILKDNIHLDAQIQLYLFFRIFGPSVIPKETHLSFSISTDTHAYVQNDCPEACSFLLQKQRFDFLSDFLKIKTVLYLYTPIRRKINTTSSINNKALNCMQHHKRHPTKATIDPK